jgi:acyl dehydratase
MKTLPRVTAIEIEGVRHMAPVTHPDRVNTLIERHLELSDARELCRRGQASKTPG